MNVSCTKYHRMTPALPRRDSYQPGVPCQDGARRSRRHSGGRWVGAAAAGALVLACLLLAGYRPSDAEELAWLNRLAAADNPDAQLQLALAYREGRYGLTPDAKAGQYWLDRAAGNGQEYAADLLAGTPAAARPETADAVRSPIRSRLDVLATELKSPILGAVSTLWKVMAFGMTNDQSADGLPQRARSGDPVAEYQLAMRYRDGAWSVNRDPAKAFYWLQRAAADGNPLAMQGLADVYRTGELGVTRDLERATRWQRRATAQSGVHR
jgi:TPR repeat protein